ncbi:MAG: hypothetical protein K0U15_06485, partial [Proteobacteria bacterium]|nr:hypothetical protein [Pseudomonadota bacterium]
MPYVTLVVDGDFVYLSLTTFLPNKGIGEVVIEVNDGLSKAAMTVSVIGNFKSLTDDSVSGVGSLLVIGGHDENHLYAETWSTDDAMLQWVKIADGSDANSPLFLVDTAEVFYNGYIYLMGGLVSSNSQNILEGVFDVVWRSVDGVNWENIGTLPDGVRSGAGLVVQNNKMVLMGGTETGSNSNDNIRSVWSTTDGISWEKLTDSFPELDINFAHAVLNNTIYVAGGQGQTNNRRVWSSSDGANWVAIDNVFSLEEILSEDASAVSFNGTLFIINGRNVVGVSSNRYVHYSSTPSDAASWQSYTRTAGENLLGAAIIVYDDRILMMGGFDFSNYVIRNEIWASAGGVDDWELINNDWISRTRANAIVIGDELTPAQVSPIEVAIVSVSNVTVGIATNDLMATVTVYPGYVGAVASLAIAGGYLGGGDYQISSSGDDSVLQVGANQQISIISAQSAVGQTFQLTMVVNDHYADNAADTKTLVLALEVVPSLTVSLSGPAEVTLLAGPLGDANVNFYTLTAEVSGGSGNYHYQFSNSDAYLLPYVTLVVDGDFVYLSLTTFLPDKGIGEVVIEVNDGLSKAAMTVSVIGNFKSLTDDSVSGSGKLLVFGGGGKLDVWSVDGSDLANWDELTVDGYSAGEFQKAVYYNGTVYVAGGLIDSDAMWRSADGVSWAQSDLPNNRVHHALVVLNNKMILFGGSTSGTGGGSAHTDSWSSTDGINWSLLKANGVPAFPFGPVYAVFNNTLYAAGGRSSSSDNNDLWSSGDGITWTQHPNLFANNISDRLTRSMFVFRGTLFVVEGNTDVASDVSKKVYYSSNPTSGEWEYYANTEVDTLRSAQILVYKEQILIVGGADNGVTQGDIWASQSGLAGSWTKIESGLDFLRRERHVAIVLGDELTPAQVPRIEVAIVSVSNVTVGIATNGLMATVTVYPGYVGAVASLAIAGGYLGGGDYQISSSGDDSVLQLGVNRQISIISAQSAVGQTVQLTM